MIPVHGVLTPVICLQHVYHFSLFLWFSTNICGRLFWLFSSGKNLVSCLWFTCVLNCVFISFSLEALNILGLMVRSLITVSLSAAKNICRKRNAWKSICTYKVSWQTMDLIFSLLFMKLQILFSWLASMCFLVRHSLILGIPSFGCHFCAANSPLATLFR